MAIQYVPEEFSFEYAPLLPPRAAIEAAGETLVAVLDAMSGDSDVELNGDELDGTSAEDEIGNRHLSHVGLEAGPGCPIADPDFAVDDNGCDPEEGY